MAAFVLDADEAALEADPGRPARRQDLSGDDQRAFREQGSALMTYRELARMSLVEPLEDMFPILKALLEDAGAWDACVQGFLEARVVRSPHYRDIAPSFLGWLAETRWGQDRWPFLLELAHAELLEVLVARYPDSEPPAGLHAEPEPGDLVVLAAATQVVSYSHAVHRSRIDSPVPEARPSHLLAFRDPDGEARLMDLTPATAALLRQVQDQPLAEAAGALGFADLDPVLDLLRGLRRDGAIAGFLPIP
jgi:hypothetical protein